VYKLGHSVEEFESLKALVEHYMHTGQRGLTQEATMKLLGGSGGGGGGGSGGGGGKMEALILILTCCFQLPL